jgi:hypothetical protein
MIQITIGTVTLVVMICGHSVPGEPSHWNGRNEE